MGTSQRSNFALDGFFADSRTRFAAFLQPQQQSDLKQANWTLWLWFAFFVAAAIIFRAPTYLFSELNWDEALYRLMADSLLRGHAPYTEIWDRKPVGVFVVFAGIQGLFGSDILALRLVASIGVGTSAFFLALLARRIFSDGPLTGVLAGLFYILYSLRNGGDAINTELVFTPFYLAGAVILFRSAEYEGRKLFVSAFCAGLLAGIAVQIKYVVIFDILAFAIIYGIMQLRSFTPAVWQKFFLVILATGLGIAVPTGIAFLWYAVIGQFDTFLVSNISANEALVGETAPPFGYQWMIDGLKQYDALIIGAAAALAAGPLLANTAERRRSWLAIVVWLLSMCLSLIFLRRFANHMFIQALPAISVATAWILVRASQTASLGRTATRLVLASTVAFLALWTAHDQFDVAFETVVKRQIDGISHWGDRTATIAAALSARLRPSDEIYVFGPELGIYENTKRLPPTRFPFTEHLWSGYAPVNGADEIHRIMTRHPAFIVVTNLWMPNGPAPDPAREKTAAELFDTINRDYVIDGNVSRFMSGGGGFVGGGIGATVFRRRDIPRFETTAALQYTAQR